MPKTSKPSTSRFGEPGIRQCRRWTVSVRGLSCLYSHCSGAGSPGCQDTDIALVRRFWNHLFSCHRHRQRTKSPFARSSHPPLPSRTATLISLAPLLRKSLTSFLWASTAPFPRKSSTFSLRAASGLLWTCREQDSRGPVKAARTARTQTTWSNSKCTSRFSNAKGGMPRPYTPAMETRAACFRSLRRHHIPVPVGAGNVRGCRDSRSQLDDTTSWGFDVLWINFNVGRTGGRQTPFQNSPYCLDSLYCRQGGQEPLS